MFKTKKLFLIGLLTLALILPLAADEGMWLFNLPPKDLLKAKHNFLVSDEWLKHIQLSSVRFGGASGSFISPDGLVLTNHHVGQRAIQNLSTPENNLMQAGFYARTRAEELKCPNMELMVLQEIEDVTSVINAAEALNMTAAQAAEARHKASADLEKKCSEQTGLRCQVVTLYSGALYHLYKYKVYTDVRLVFTPEFLTAFFGGDPDNFTYPRYDLDITLFRIYENGQPLRTPYYIRWARRNVGEGDLVFASGNPGSTGRLLTMAQLEFLRDVNYPLAIANYARRQALLHAYSQKGAEQARVALQSLFGIENSLKATRGYQSGLLDKKLMAKKAAEEKAFRQAVLADTDLSKECGQAWDEIAATQKAYASFYKAYYFFERGQGFNSTYFTIARNLVRMAMEKTKPNAERLREFTDSNLASVQRRTLSPAPLTDEFEVLQLADSLAQLQEELGETPEVKWILAGRDPETAAKELVSGTKLKNMEIRKKYVEGGLEAVYLSPDPMIKLVLLIDPVSRGLRLRYEREVDSVEIRNGALLARALFKLKGTSVPPDATSTLRLSFGVVKGYVENNKKIPFQTTYAGLYRKSEQNGNKDPYELPPSFLRKKSALNLGVALNFVSTADSIGGNSGSPVVNRNGELVGVLFDGNIQSLPTRFVYDDEIARSVMVHSQGIIEALRKIYRADPLVEEILGQK
jgi:hypothetical protein